MLAFSKYTNYPNHKCHIYFILSKLFTRTFSYSHHISRDEINGNFGIYLFYEWLWYMFCVYGYGPEPHLPYNEIPTRPLNTTSLKCCLPSADAIDRREKYHACVWRFKVVSCKRALLKSTRFSQKMSNTFLTG